MYLVYSWSPKIINLLFLMCNPCDVRNLFLLKCKFCNVEMLVCPDVFYLGELDLDGGGRGCTRKKRRLRGRFLNCYKKNWRFHAPYSLYSSLSVPLSWTYQLFVLWFPLHQTGELEKSYQYSLEQSLRKYGYPLTGDEEVGFLFSSFNFFFSISKFFVSGIRVSYGVTFPVC